ncbi:MAG: YgeY family selenium metabolism-linked hydrolase [Ardenticatenales bacterium]|nr:YgeY family selenium metabolism-linked hydrolase [Ardenticatenales bacterium]
MTISPEVIQQLQARVEEQRDTLVTFLRELCAIPSMESQIGPVGERVAEEMRRLGFHKVWFDSMGNIVGEIGNGPRTLLYDSHIDTVGVGDPEAWQWDPFQGKVEDGMLWARGACDEKGSTPGMIYGLAWAHEMGLLDGWRGVYFGNMEEWCDGIAPHALVEHEGLKPDFVVIGEPTKMGIYRGHKGRVELQVFSKGKSAHAASNQLGDNAIYKLLPVIEGIRDLNDQLPTDDFLGQGRITVSKMDVETPSINAVPDLAVLTIDRRLTWGEKKEDALLQVEQLIPEHERSNIEVKMMFYEDPSYTGFVFPVDKYFPAWQIPEESLIVQAGQRTYEALWGEPTHIGKWSFSTNGIYWNGKAGIPSIGFGPGDEVTAHTTEDSVSLDDVARSAAWYALFPTILKELTA